MAVCSICGKQMSLFGVSGNVWIVNKSYPIEAGELKLCETCYASFVSVNNVAKIANYEVRASINSKKIEHYKKNARRWLEMNERNISNSWLALEVERLTGIANEVCDYNDEYEAILQDSIDRITVDYNALPSDQAHCGYSTFANDGKRLFYMKYGAPICNSNELFDETDVMLRVNVAREFKHGILERDCLIESIEIKDIIYFQEKGEVGYSTDVTGGGSEGVNYAGAFIGGILFGTAGAVVGGMSGNKVEEIKSKAIEHDNRYVVIRFLNNGKTVERKAAYQYFDVLNQLIPEKEYSYINMSTSIEKVETPLIGNLPFEELKKLKELLDLGIITLDDFEQKKKQLLGL